jgi:2-polyprenyl-3-methyl-5-hydroxy-6-metoxy-1,4-benzoquinol methylase
MTDHQHEHEQPANTGLDQASWEDRYRDAPALWSGRVNPSLVVETADLPPGRALDVGCGEGGDVLWLAGQGWQVTGLDWSAVALERAAEHAAAADLTDRVRWVQGDVESWQPQAASFDLVTAHFLHPTADQQSPLLARLGAAVAPGGTLLWVGHAVQEEAAAQWGADRFAAATDLAAHLDPADWEVVVAVQRPRPEGSGHHVADEVVRARRR